MRRRIMYNDSLFNAFARSFEARSETEMSMAEYLESCRGDPMRYANAAERLLAAIGEPQIIDTAKDPRLGRIFLNRTMRAYPAFAGFYGMEETIERIVGFFRHAAQGLEERKQILYLLGPVGGGKSSLAERLKALMEVHPIYVLKAGDELSPVFESPLSLFDPEQLGSIIEEKYGIPRRRLNGLMSPWCLKRLEMFGGDISRFRVAKIQPSRLRQVAIAKTEPGDENNQDMSSLVGKVDIRKLESLPQNDPDAYSYSGGLNRANQGILEFVEMFKAPIKMLHPLLTATQEGNYIGTENIGAVPFTGVILAHSNESEWQSFKANKNNEAFIDRICVIKVPYCLRVTYRQCFGPRRDVTAQRNDAVRGFMCVDAAVMGRRSERTSQVATYFKWSKTGGQCRPCSARRTAGGSRCIPRIVGGAVEVVKALPVRDGDWDVSLADDYGAGGFKPLDRNSIFGRHEASRGQKTPCGRQSCDIRGFFYRHGDAEKRTVIT